MTHSTVVLADGTINHQTRLTIELIKNEPPTVQIRWPKRPTMASPSRFPELISQITRLLSNASIELARIQAADKRH
jgi:hypothetical protein